MANPDNYFHLAGGSFGGPIIHNRTFFWASSEGYQTFTGRNTVLTLPTERERNGDFSQSGITIYDPLTYDPVDRDTAAVSEQRDSGEPHQPSRAERAHPCAAADLGKITSGGRRAPRQGDSDHGKGGPPVE